MPTQNGTSQSGKAWQKREFIIEETVGNYPNSIVITAFGDRVEKLNTLRVGDYVTARFDTQAREYNGRAFNNITLYDITQPQAQAMPQPQAQVYMGAPQQAMQQQYQAAPAQPYQPQPQAQPMQQPQGQRGDDLPF
nr:MAG TPA: Single-stranded DNA-binding protein fold, inter-subunit clamp, Paralogous.5A [Caudoviricetes sp.]